MVPESIKHKIVRLIVIYLTIAAALSFNFVTAAAEPKRIALLPFKINAEKDMTFLQNGIFDRATAQAFEEHILSKGGTAHPMDLYLKFRKQPPDSDALLRRAGLVEN